LVPEVTAFQVKLIGFIVFGRALGDSVLLRAGELCLERLGNLCGNLAFDRKDVRQFPIVLSAQRCESFSALMS
jgi:hypothetical protein